MVIMATKRKMKRQLKRAAGFRKMLVDELVGQIDYHRYLYADPQGFDPEANEMDQQYWNGMKDGLVFALSLIDKSAIPAMPDLSTDKNRVQFFFDHEDDIVLDDSLLDA